jgi:hypothetical protein
MFQSFFHPVFEFYSETVVVPCCFSSLLLSTKIVSDAQIFPTMNDLPCDEKSGHQNELGVIHYDEYLHTRQQVFYYCVLSYRTCFPSCIQNQPLHPC